jgi:hypothetical protein
VEGKRATSAARLSRAEAPQVMIRKNSMNTRHGVRSDSNSGEPVDHSGPGLSKAHNSSNTRSNAEGLPTNLQWHRRACMTDHGGGLPIRLIIRLVPPQPKVGGVWGRGPQ